MDERETAQATVEFVGTLPLLALALVLCVQALLLAVGVVVAQPAVDRAAHGAARAQVLAVVPAAYRRRAVIHERSGRAEVILRVPRVLPGAGRWLQVRASSRVVSS